MFVIYFMFILPMWLSKLESEEILNKDEELLSDI